MGWVYWANGDVDMVDHGPVSVILCITDMSSLNLALKTLAEVYIVLCWWLNLPFTGLKCIVPTQINHMQNKRKRGRITNDQFKSSRFPFFLWYFDNKLSLFDNRNFQKKHLMLIYLYLLVSFKAIMNGLFRNWDDSQFLETYCHLVLMEMGI